jgi:hypothetical protein
MERLRFNFCHPVKGYASLTQLSKGEPQCRRIVIDSKDNTFIEIPVNEYQEGKLKVVLDWEYDGRSFSHQEEFEINK